MLKMLPHQGPVWLPAHYLELGEEETALFCIQDTVCIQCMADCEEKQHRCSYKGTGSRQTCRHHHCIITYPSSTCWILSFKASALPLLICSTTSARVRMAVNPTFLPSSYHRDDTTHNYLEQESESEDSTHHTTAALSSATFLLNPSHPMLQHTLPWAT